MDIISTVQRFMRNTFITLYFITSVRLFTFLKLLNCSSTKFLSSILHSLFCIPRASIQGEENIIRDSSSVVVINRQSVLDLLVVTEFLFATDNCAVITTDKSYLLWLAGVTFVDKNQNVGIPKGKITQIFVLSDGKKEPFDLALVLKYPIQPVAVNTFLDDTESIKIEVLPSVMTEDCSSENIEELVEKTHHLMSESSKLLTIQETQDLMKATTSLIRLYIKQLPPFE